MLPVERLELSTVPSPFLNGLLDEFLHDERLAPIIETNRGCPYNCSFCVWGQATLTKLRKFDLNTVVDEIHYISKETKNPTKFILEELTYNQQEELFLMNIYGQNGSDALIKAMLSGDMNKAMRLYAEFHHTNLNVLDDKEINKKFNKEYK